MIGKAPICLDCKHFKDVPSKKKVGAVFSCDAFRKIPDEIWMSEVDHHKPYKGDNGIRFEAKR